jgi:hypothetical protein
VLMKIKAGPLLLRVSSATQCTRICNRYAMSCCADSWLNKLPWYNILHPSLHKQTRVNQDKTRRMFPLHLSTPAQMTCTHWSCPAAPAVRCVGRTTPAPGSAGSEQ